MSTVDHAWVVILAAGDGSRLAPLTVDSTGTAVPKQYCSFNGGSSLLEEAISRACSLVPPERVCVVVAGKHHVYWLPMLADIPLVNVFAQPENRGTANGILLATLVITDSDPQSNILFMPADHYAADEKKFRDALSRTMRAGNSSRQHFSVLAMEPEEPDPEFSYIVPGSACDDGTWMAERFVETPEKEVAATLLAKGALWNTFIFSATGSLLYRTFRRMSPDIVFSMEKALFANGLERSRAIELQAAYKDFPAIDFSNDVLQGREHTIRIIRAAACGWTDLGTPQRMMTRARTT